MNLSELGAKALVTATNYTKKNAPSILTGIGIAGGGVTMYLVGRAVLRAQPVIGGMKADAANITSHEIDENYTKQTQVKQIGELYVRRSATLIRIFTPAVAVGSASVICILASHGLMHQRQAGLVAAYTALDAGYKAYRQRVREELGDEKDLDFYRGVTRSESDPIGENGETCIIENYTHTSGSPYSFFFEATNHNWSKTAEYSKLFLIQQQDYYNDRLRAYGFVFLNEVLQDLGFPRTQAGQVVGWKLKSETGDGHIDFGLFNLDNERVRAFMNGDETCVMLDFNVDGPINI